MSTVVFVLNRSPSMLQRPYNGVGYLDFAKNTIEAFIRRLERMTFLNDSYRSIGFEYVLITTCESGFDVVRAKSLGTQGLLSYVQELEVDSSFDITDSLSHAFEFLNQSKVGVPSYDFDNFGRGWLPWTGHCEAIVLLTCLEYNDEFLKAEGGRVQAHASFSPRASVQRYAGAELYEDSHRYYQKVFVFLYENSYAATPKVVNSEVHSDVPKMKQMLHRLCAKTGGSMYIISSAPDIGKACERVFDIISRRSTVYELSVIKPGSLGPHKVPSEVETMIFHLQPLKAPKAQEEARQGRKPSVPSTLTFSGRWIIPEDFKLSTEFRSLPKRDSNPVLYITKEVVEINIPREFWTDVFALSFTDHALNGVEALGSLEGGKTKYWLVYKKIKDFADGGGIETASRPFGVITMLQGKVVLGVLPYDFERLFRILQKMTQGNVDKHLSAVKDYLLSTPCFYMNNHNSISKISPLLPSQFLFGIVRENDLPRRIAAFIRAIVKTSSPQPMMHGSSLLDERAQSRVDPFSVSRWRILDEVIKMKKRLFGTTFLGETDDMLDRAVPVVEMGDYSRKRTKDLREVTPASATARRHSFGNPFKRKVLVQVDEMDRISENISHTSDSAQTELSAISSKDPPPSYHKAIKLLKRSSLRRSRSRTQARTDAFRKAKRDVTFIVRHREMGVRRAVALAREMVSKASKSEELSAREAHELTEHLNSLLEAFGIRF